MSRGCERWDGSRCTLGLGGGVPSEGVCSVCPKYEGPSRGVGDTMHYLFVKVGIAKEGDDCGGCGQRRAIANAALPYGGY